VKVDFKEIFNFRYIRQNITLGIYSVMTSMYLTFNVMYLGLVTDNVQVGYYTTAYKLYTVVLGFFSAFTSVMLPRMSALVSEEQTDRFKRLVSKSFSAMSMFSMPLILCSLVMAPQIVAVLAGPGYEGAVLPMRIIMPAVLFVGVAQVLALQILMPMQKEKVLLAASVTGAVVAVIVNMLSVKALQGVGSAVVLLCSEFVVTMVYVIYIYRNKIVALPWSEIVKNLLVSLPSVAVAVLCAATIANEYISLGVGIVAAVLVWAVMMVAFRRETLMDVIGRRR
jgi:O-antigen/teichoic acid export membrane protein